MTELDIEATCEFAIKSCAPGLTNEHCEGRHRSVDTNVDATAGANNLFDETYTKFDEKLKPWITAAAANARDLVENAEAALEEEVRAAVEDGIVTEEEQEVLDQKKAILISVQQMHAMLDGAMQLHTAVAQDAKKARSNKQQMETNNHRRVLELNDMVSEFEHEKAQEEQIQGQVLFRENCS